MRTLDLGVSGIGDVLYLTFLLSFVPSVDLERLILIVLLYYTFLIINLIIACMVLRLICPDTNPWVWLRVQAGLVITQAKERELSAEATRGLVSAPDSLYI